MPAKLPAHKRKLYHELRYGMKLSRTAAYRRAGVSKAWSYKEDKLVESGEHENMAANYLRPDATPMQRSNNARTRTKEVTAAAEDISPLPLDLISPDAQQQLEDFHYFCHVQFGRTTTPWRRAAFARVWKLWDSPEKEYAIVNAPPGIGKSVMFTHDFPVWLTVRDRYIRGLIGSSSQRLATRYTRRMRDTFARRFPLEASPLEIKLGLAIDAASTLITDFGRFRSGQVEQLWAAEQFEIELLQGFDTGEKEPTWQAYGRDSEQLGNRVNLALWDDLVTRKTLNLTRSEEFVEWFTDEAETRLEPGGLFLPVGQRIDTSDLYRNRLDAIAVDIDDEGNEVRAKKYKHFIFPAHIDENCTGDHARDAQPADFNHSTGDPIPGTGCLLDPARQTWSELSQVRSGSSRKFAVLYQQEDVSEGTKLVSHLWVVGGENSDGEIFNGCLDVERNILEVPEHLDRSCPSVASVDPSVRNKWAVEWWINDPKFDIDHLIDLYKGELTAGELLSYNVSNGEFYGIMDEWQQRSVAMGRKITHWVVETNVQQRYLLQHDFVHQWTRRHGVTLVAHTTHSHNKHDVEHGFWQMRNQWRLGKTRIPAHPDTAHIGQQLIDEVYIWPTPHAEDDAAMAYWMYRIKIPMIQRRTDDAPAAAVFPPAPTWLQ